MKEIIARGVKGETDKRWRAGSARVKEFLKRKRESGEGLAESKESEENKIFQPTKKISRSSTRRESESKGNWEGIEEKRGWSEEMEKIRKELGQYKREMKREVEKRGGVVEEKGRGLNKREEGMVSEDRRFGEKGGRKKWRTDRGEWIRKGRRRYKRSEESGRESKGDGS